MHKIAPFISRDGFAFAFGAFFALFLISLILRFLGRKKMAREHVEQQPARAINSEVRRQMDSLSAFRQMAIKHLAVKGGMTEPYFSQLVMDMGFPVLTLQQQNAIGATLSELANATTLLTKNPESDQWLIKPQFIRDDINYLHLLNHEDGDGPGQSG